MLLLPLMLEQQLTADAIVRLGAGERAAAGDGASVRGKLGALLASDRCADAARRFVAKYAPFDPAKQVERMVERVEKRVNTVNPREGGPRPGRASKAPAGVFRRDVATFSAGTPASRPR